MEVKVFCKRGLIHGRTFDFRVHGPSSRPRIDLFVFLPFSFFFNLKLLIMPFSYFVIQFDIKTFGSNL